MDKFNNKWLELNIELYRKIYLIRKSEEKIRVHYHENDMKTPMHMSVGEEAIAAGVCHALGEQGQIFGSYRSHAIYLAKTGETDKFFAEMYGKKTGIAKGKGGSMHLSAPENGFLGTSAIVAGTIPIAVGTAFSNKQNKNNKMAAVFFGDGAIDEGVFWESLNFACLMNIPVLFVCEDNGFAVHYPPSVRHGYNSICDIVAKFNCNVLDSETTDVEIVYELTCNAMEVTKNTQRPAFLYLKYYRYLEHVGVNEDFDCGYRSKEEFTKWYKVDPVNLQRKKLIEKGCPEKEVQKVEIEISNQIDNSIALAKKAPFADESELYEDVYA